MTQESLSAERTTAEIVAAAIDGGIDVVQLREKNTDARSRYDIGLELRVMTADADVALLVNDRVDIARAIGADGVHVGQTDLPVSVCRDLLGPDVIVGCSASTVDAALRAEADGADYLGVGSVYGTTSKDVEGDRDGIGTDRVSAIADAVSIPIVGIGGISTDNAASVIEAGADSVAVISEITAAADPRGAAERLRDRVTRELSVEGEFADEEEKRQ